MVRTVPSKWVKYRLAKFEYWSSKVATDSTNWLAASIQTQSSIASAQALWSQWYSQWNDWNWWQCHRVAYFRISFTVVAFRENKIRRPEWNGREKKDAWRCELLSLYHMLDCKFPSQLTTAGGWISGEFAPCDSHRVRKTMGVLCRWRKKQKCTRNYR